MTKKGISTGVDGKMLFYSFEMYETLVEHCQSNIQYFVRDDTTAGGKQFLDAFRGILQRIEIIRRHVMEIHEFVHEYDVDEMTPASGYRSVVKATHEYIKHTTEMSKYVAENRGKLLFRKQTYVK